MAAKEIKLLMFCTSIAVLLEILWETFHDICKSSRVVMVFDSHLVNIA